MFWRNISPPSSGRKSVEQEASQSLAASLFLGRLIFGLKYEGDTFLQNFARLCIPEVGNIHVKCFNYRSLSYDLNQSRYL
jgi:hypothetical protein